MLSSSLRLTASTSSTFLSLMVHSRSCVVGRQQTQPYQLFAALVALTAAGYFDPRGVLHRQKVLFTGLPTALACHPRRQTADHGNVEPRQKHPQLTKIYDYFPHQ